MQFKRLNKQFSVSDQIVMEDITTLRQEGIRTLICNRPDGEAADQPAISQLTNRARQEGMEVIFMPVVHDLINASDVENFEHAWNSATFPVHAFCRSGTRSLTLWSLMKIRQGSPVDEMVSLGGAMGFDFSKFKTRFAAELKAFNANTSPLPGKSAAYDIVVVGGGSAGISVASSLLKRSGGLSIAIIEPANTHYYQPGFTMIGGGIFTPPQTCRPMAQVMPSAVTWIRETAASFLPDENRVVLASGASVEYKRLIICCGLKLDWNAIEGLAETLGSNGVTSNYHPDCASYTWELVQKLKQGRAVFTQPPMPIKCAGAPQKALYLSADHWFRNGLLNDISIDFYNAGAVLFGVKEYVPALQSYIDKYKAQLHFGHNLKRVDGKTRTAWFESKDSDGNVKTTAVSFDMLHVCPPQCAPDFIRASTLTDAAGWVDIDPETLQHKRYANIWSLGDVCNTPNAKTAAAVRKQAPVVAANIIADIRQSGETYAYDGYGSCPLTVERGKIVLAEFGYGGKLLPTFPTWLLDGLKPTRLAWFLKKSLLPPVYWSAMLKAHEWFVKPVRRKVSKAESV